MLRKLLIIPPIAAGLFVLFYLVNNKEEPQRKPPEEIARAVRVVEMVEVDFVPRVVGYGTVQPGRVWDGTAQVSGEIEFMHEDLNKGAILPSGTEILRISPLDYELAITRAEANIRSAEARLLELEVTETNTRDTLALEERVLEIRETELQRNIDLVEQEVYAQAVVDQEMRDTLTQRQRVLDLKNSLRLIPTQVAVEEEQRAVYLAELESAKLDLERTHIILPFDARIAEVNVEETQFVQVGSVMMVADSVEKAEIEAQVPVSQFRMMTQAVSGEEADTGVSIGSFAAFAERFGISVIVRLRTGDDVTEWPGSFARISDTIDPSTRTVGIIAEVDGAYATAVPGERPPLAKGFFVELEIRARSVPGQIVVPRSIVNNDAVYVMTAEDRLERRDVEVGARLGDLAVITSGLVAGERVVVSDLVPAVEGMLLAAQVDEALSSALIAEATAQAPLR